MLVLLGLHLSLACMRQYPAHVLPVWFHMQPSVRPWSCVSLPDLPQVLWLLLLHLYLCAGVGLGVGDAVGLLAVQICLGRPVRCNASAM